MSELSGVFKGLNDAFDTDFEEEENMSLQVMPEDDKNNLPVEKTNNDEIMHNTDFVTNELKNLIQTSKSVLSRLDADIKIGTKHRAYEVYSQMNNSITAQLKELRKLHESVAKIKIDQGKMKLNNVGVNDKISLTSEQLLDLVDKAKERSEINEIDADFKVDDEDLLPTIEE